MAVARIITLSNRINWARSDTEEGYFESSDPYISVQFFHWHPQYIENGNWTDWPENDSTGISEIWTNPLSICPDHYGAYPNINGDERYWYADATIPFRMMLDSSQYPSTTRCLLAT